MSRKLKYALIGALVVSVAINLIAGYYLWSFYVLFRTMLGVG